MRNEVSGSSGWGPSAWIVVQKDKQTNKQTKPRKVGMEIKEKEQGAAFCSFQMAGGTAFPPSCHILKCPSARTLNFCFPALHFQHISLPHQRPCPILFSLEPHVPFSTITEPIGGRKDMRNSYYC